MRQRLGHWLDGAGKHADRWETILLVAILLLGAWLRFWQIAHVPPGLWYDEAANGIDARYVLSGEHPIFFEGNNGREPLFIYLTALAFRLFGPSATALRLIGAIIGLAALLLSYLLARRMFGWRVAMVAAFLLATSYWHISLSRLGLRAGLLPLAEVAALYCLWRGLQEQSWRWFASAGALVGLVGYTYLAGRFTPVWLGIFLLAALLYRPWRHGMSTRRYVVGIALLLAGAAIVFAPLGLYYLQSPAQFFSRTGGIAATSSSMETTWASELDTLGMFTFAGDANSRHNLPGRPVFDWIQGAAFYGGIALALVRWRKPAGMLCVIWAAIMLLPGALSNEAPHFLRTAGILPAPMYLGAYAVVAATDSLGAWARRHHHLLVYWTGTAALSVALAWGAVSAAYDYFGRWAPSRATYDAFQSDSLAAASIAGQLSSDNKVVLSVESLYRGLPVPLGMYDHSPRVTVAPWADGCLVVPAERREPMYYVVTGGNPFTSEGTGGDLLRGMTLDRIVRGPDGAPGVLVYRAGPGDVLPLEPGRPARVRLGDAIEIVGYDFPARVAPGARAWLRVYWKALQPASEPGDWQFFAHLVDANDGMQTSAYQDGCPPNKLQPGDMAVSLFPLAIPPETLAGTYRLMFGRFERHTEERLNAYDMAGRDIGKSLLLTRLRVTDEPTQAYSPRYSATARFGTSLELVGYDLSGDAASPGKPLDVTLYWRAEGQVNGDYTVFAQLLDAAGRVVAQSDSEPQSGAYPTSLWGDDEVVTDQHRLALPAVSVAQGLRLIVGMYDLATGNRLPVSTSGGAPDRDYFELPIVQRP